jgi:hypothetical protein
MGVKAFPSPFSKVPVARDECRNCVHWVRNYDVTPITMRRNLPVMHASVTGWCLLDIPAIAHPTITGWSEVKKEGEDVVGIETRDTSICISYDDGM